MLPVGIILGFLGYDLGTWGYILVKGYNITLRQWSSPFSPFTGSLDANGLVPKGHIFPTGARGSSGGGDTGTGSSDPAVLRANQAAKNSDRERPGQVSSRY